MLFVDFDQCISHYGVIKHFTLMHNYHKDGWCDSSGWNTFYKIVLDLIIEQSVWMEYCDVFVYIDNNL